MSPAEPGHPNPLMEQARIVNEVAQLVLDEVPQPCDLAVVEFRALTDSAEDGLTVTHGGRSRKDFPPEDHPQYWGDSSDNCTSAGDGCCGRCAMKGAVR